MSKYRSYKLTELLDEYERNKNKIAAYGFDDSVSRGEYQNALEILNDIHAEFEFRDQLFQEFVQESGL